MDDITTRFYSKTASANDGSGCLLWTATLFRDGYGQFAVDQRPKRAHRWIYQKHHGVTLTPDEHVLHSCDTPQCVEISHLSVGTNLDNHREKVERGRSPWGERNVKAKLNAEQVAAIRTEYATGTTTQKALAARYGVRQQTISWITTGKHWTGKIA